MHTRIVSLVIGSMLVINCSQDSLKSVPPPQNPFIPQSQGDPRAPGDGNATPTDPTGVHGDNRIIQPPGGDRDREPPPGDATPPTTCQTGALLGRLCLPGTSQALNDALVYLWAIDCLGNTNLYETTSESNGQFSLAGVPAGTHTLYIEHSAHESSVEVTVVPGEIVVVDAMAGEALCVDNAPPRAAIITGEWDSVDVLLDTLGITYDVYDYYTTSGPSPALEFLSDFSAMTNYDVIFFNCGNLQRDFLSATVIPGDNITTADQVYFDFSADTYQNLRAFVTHGGDIYASDWAFPIAEGLNPNVIDFYDDESDGVKVLVGKAESIAGHVDDSSLSLFLGTTSVPVDFDLDAWAVIDDVAAGTHVYMRGDITAVPWNALGGSTEYPLADRPLLVGYRPFAGGGYVIYTTFHYHSQPNAQMLDVLRYLIFQL